MGKPAFNPNQPFSKTEAPKPAFDPSQAFEKGPAPSQDPTPPEDTRSLSDKFKNIAYGGGEAPPQSANPLEGSDAPPAASRTDYLKGMLSSMAEPLNYGAGLGRTAWAQKLQNFINAGKYAAGKVTGEEPEYTQVVKPQDPMSALKGQAPALEEYEDRAGIPTGPSLSDVPGGGGYYPKGQASTPWGAEKGGHLDWSLRDLANLPISVLTDPLAGAGIKPVSKALENTGISVYKSAPLFKAADAHAALFNKTLPSDVFIEQQGMAGGTGRKLANRAAQGLEEKTQIANQGMERAQQLGAKPDMERAMEQAQAMADEIRAQRDPAKGFTPLKPNDPTDAKLLAAGQTEGPATGILKRLDDQIETYKALGARPEQQVSERVPSGTYRYGEPVMEDKTYTLPGQEGPTVPQTAGYKTSIYNKTPDVTWNDLRTTPDGAAANNALSGGLRNEVVQSSNAVEKGLGDQIENANQTRGAYLSTQGVFNKEALKDENKNFFTSIDGILLGHGDPAILAAKKAADAARSNFWRTHSGRAIYNASTLPQLDTLLRQHITNATQNQPDEKSHWEQLRSSP